MKIKDLNHEKVVASLLTLPLIANQMGHKWLKSTANSYLLPDPDDLEVQFIKDLFTTDTETIINTWYGGEDNASDILFQISNAKDEEVN